MHLFGNDEPRLAPDAPRGLGRAMSGGGDKAARRPNDFYPTPPDVTRALLRAENIHLLADGPIWEPCGRGGAMLRVLRDFGFDVVGTDIVADPLHGVTTQDVLAVDRAPTRRAITNPPFAIAAKIIEHLWASRRVDYMALLLKATFFHALERTRLFEDCMPSRIYALTWRPDFTGGGASTMECAWFVWDAASPPTFAPEYRLLARDMRQDGLL